MVAKRRPGVASELLSYKAPKNSSYPDHYSLTPQQPRLKAKLLNNKKSPQIDYNSKKAEFQMINKDTFGKLPSINKSRVSNEDSIEF